MNRWREVPAWLLERLACPDCSDPGLTPASGGLECSACGARYPVVDGRIPVLAADGRAGRYGEAAETRTARQVAFFDHEAKPEYEVMRPHGVPVVFGSLLVEKLRRGVQGLEACLPGGTALTVCGGSGMDAEYLARRGARVACADLSLGAARRADHRARRFGLELAPMVADAQRLPCGDRSFDLVYVHDGLHHLEDPLGAISEMARVASRGVSVNEPAEARLTAVAVRIGLAQNEEEAGNVVRRLRPEEVAEVVRSRGFEPLVAERYAMLYRHEAGPLYRLLSRPAVSGVALSALRAGDRLLGRVGNKLSVRAIRS
jgi:ubiquinone/menaquinone biosynthesis C-methylase UbiE/uncharacterized protein YbaR (Trm112 family)